jgi:hypothetical protein
MLLSIWGVTCIIIVVVTVSSLCSRILIILVGKVTNQTYIFKFIILIFILYLPVWILSMGLWLKMVYIPWEQSLEEFFLNGELNLMVSREPSEM